MAVKFCFKALFKNVISREIKNVIKFKIFTMILLSLKFVIHGLITVHLGQVPSETLANYSKSYKVMICQFKFKHQISSPTPSQKMLRLLVQIILSANFFNLCPIFKYDTVERLYTVPQCLSVPGTSIYRAYDFPKPLVISQSCCAGKVTYHSSYHF